MSNNSYAKDNTVCHATSVLPRLTVQAVINTAAADMQSKLSWHVVLFTMGWGDVHLLKRQLWVMNIQQVMMPRLSCKTCRVLASKAV